MGSSFESSSAKRDRRQAKTELARQKQIEAGALAEAEDEIGRRRALAASPRSGRRSLIRSSPTGLATTLGGT